MFYLYCIKKEKNSQLTVSHFHNENIYKSINQSSATDLIIDYLDY